MSDQKLDLIMSELQRLGTSMNERFESMEERFESFEKRFESLEERFESMEERFEKRFESMEERLERIESTMATKDDIARLEHKIDLYHMENITADEKLLELIGSTNEKLDAHIAQTASDLVIINHSIDILNDRQLRLEAEWRNR